MVRPIFQHVAATQLISTAVAAGSDHLWRCHSWRAAESAEFLETAPVEGHRATGWSYSWGAAASARGSMPVTICYRVKFAAGSSNWWLSIALPGVQLLQDAQQSGICGRRAHPASLTKGLATSQHPQLWERFPIGFRKQQATPVSPAWALTQWWLVIDQYWLLNNELFNIPITMSNKLVVNCNFNK